MAGGLGGVGPVAGAGSTSSLSRCHFPAPDSAESPGASPVPAGSGHALPLSFEGNSQKQSPASGELRWEMLGLPATVRVALGCGFEA